jgi:hypothetical protein
MRGHLERGEEPNLWQLADVLVVERASTSQERSTEEDQGDREIDHETRNIDQHGHE